MGAPTTTSYTNLFMDMFETSHLNDFHKIWLRFIDNIFFIWTDSEDSLR